jgi:hypothetical protein
MTFVDVIGYSASGLVVVTFYMKDMVPLRIAALCSNIAFLTYGITLGLGPVVLLHATLIPLNLWRLSSALPATVKAERAAATEPDAFAVPSRHNRRSHAHKSLRRPSM